MPRDRISRFGGKMLPLRRKSARGASKIHSDLGKRCKNCGEELRGSIAPDGFCVEKQHVGMGFGVFFALSVWAFKQFFGVSVRRSFWRTLWLGVILCVSLVGLVLLVSAGVVLTVLLVTGDVWK